MTRKCEQRRRVWPLVVAVICAVAVVAALALAFFRPGAGITEKDDLPMPFGFGLAVVASGSMTPAIQVDDLVVVQPQNDYKTGDVVVYRSGDSLIMHRVVECEGNVLTTQGDANNTPDAPITVDAVQGAVVLSIPSVGAAVSALKSPVAILLILLAAVSLMWLLFRPRQSESKARLSDLEDEVSSLKAQLSRERVAHTQGTTTKNSAEQRALPLSAMSNDHAAGFSHYGRSDAVAQAAAKQTTAAHTARPAKAAKAACALVVCIAACACLAVGVGARFATEDTASDSARVAAFVLTTEGVSAAPFDLSDIEKPGDKKEYIFSVSNADNGAVSEVALRYLFTMELAGNMPLECTITRDTGGAEVLSIGSSSVSPTGEATDSLESETTMKTAEVGQFAAAERRTDIYKLTVVWPEGKNDVEYASHSSVAEVKLTVSAEQID